MIESITFNTTVPKLTVTFDDGSSKDYTDAVSYLTDHPNREADVVAIKWSIK